MSACGPLKHSARNWTAASPLPLLLDFLAPAWAFPSTLTDDAFFEPSFKPVLHLNSPASFSEASQSANRNDDETQAESSLSRSPTYTRIVSIKQATPVAFTGYTSANFGLASPEWASLGPSPRTFAAPWRSQPNHFSTLVTQRQLTTLPQSVTSQNIHVSPPIPQSNPIPASTGSIARTPAQTISDRLALLEEAIRTQSCDEAKVAAQWEWLLQMFWRHQAVKDPNLVLSFGRALLRHGFLLESWDVRKVFLKWSKLHDITFSDDLRQLLDDIYDASLHRSHVRRATDLQKERSKLSKYMWLNVTGMKYAPTLHRILLQKSTFQKAFYAFKSMWPPIRTAEDYELFITAACKEDDTRAIEHLWSELLASPQLKPTLPIFRQMISHFARVRDPDSIEFLIERMRERNMPVNRNQWTDLMRAHTAAANWSALSQIFKKMEESENEQERPDIIAVNVVLRAEVLAGAPFNIVRGLVASLPARGYQADHVTMAILMESAVDLGLLGAAETVFAQMDASPHFKPNVVHFGIMIKAYLLRHNTTVAQEYLDEMLRRGIDPSAVIYAQVIAAYLRHASVSQENQASLDSAQAFADEFKKQHEVIAARSWKEARRDRKSYNSVMVPFIASFAREFHPELALEYFQRIVQADHTPSQVAYATLIDAYRRVGDTASMKAVWARLYDQALGSTATLQKSGEYRIRGRANYLCVPLSTMIQGLGAAGQLEELSDIWQRMHQDGFGFDCSNWNHLCQALVAGDQWQSACTIAERVLLGPETLDRTEDVLSAPRVRADAEAPSRSHQERSAERQHERQREQILSAQLAKDGGDYQVRTPFLSAFGGTSERYFWRLQNQSKDAFQAEFRRRYANAVQSDVQDWEKEFPRLARVLRQHQLQQEQQEQVEGIAGATV